MRETHKQPPVATERRSRQYLDSVGPGTDDRLHFIEPASQSRALIGWLRMRVAPPAAGGRTVEVLLAWNSDPRGVTPVATCRAPLDELVAGVAPPASATTGHTGSFTIQARVVEPYLGALSAPVDVTLLPKSDDRITVRRRSPDGDFKCMP